MTIIPLVVGGAALGGLLLFASREHEQDRSIMLIQGKRYAIAWRTNSPGWDASIFPGFCNFSQPIITSTGAPPPLAPVDAGGINGWEVQFTADWCAPNRRWEVPANLAVGEL